ncbi:MAG: 16S rRNA (cytosine(1402)-N(4))-methyltransferase RsmH [Gammaproteobacteria bacterium WSBS_2016_MAG_OTU1]
MKRVSKTANKVVNTATSPDDLTHLTVLAKEAADALIGGQGHSQGEGCYIDATFGGGGHSRLLLTQLPPNSLLVALDCDEYAEALADKVEDPNFVFMRRNFADMRQAIAEAEVGNVRGVLFDLGVSSLQLDTAERGLSFMRDGPLDMRLDRRSGKTVQQFLQYSSERELVRVLKSYGEEPEARRVAKEIYARRRQIDNTATLAKIVAECKRAHPPGRHPATLVFQALRMAVNNELDTLRRGLSAASELLCQGGRLVVIAFHSLEDRLVKRTLSAPSFPGVGQVGGVGMQQEGRSIVPSEEEIAANPRARSARMRVFVKQWATT